MGAACSEVVTKNRVDTCSQNNLEDGSMYIPRSISRVENWVRRRPSRASSVGMESSQVTLDVGISVDVPCPDYYSDLFQPRISRAVRRGAVVMVTVRFRPNTSAVSPALVIRHPEIYWGMLLVERQIPKRLPMRIEEEDFRIFGVLKPESQVHSELQLHGYVDGELQLFCGYVDLHLKLGESIFGYMLQALERERAIEYISMSSRKMSFIHLYIIIPRTEILFQLDDANRNILPRRFNRLCYSLGSVTVYRVHVPVSKADLRAPGRKSSRSTNRGSAGTLDGGYISDYSSVADPPKRESKCGKVIEEVPDWLADIPEEEEATSERHPGQVTSSAYPRIIRTDQKRHQKKNRPRRKDTPAAQPNPNQLAIDLRVVRGRSNAIEEEGSVTSLPSLSPRSLDFPSHLLGPAPWEKPALPTLSTIDTTRKGVRKKSSLRVNAGKKGAPIQLPKRTKKMSVVEENPSLPSPRTNGDPSISGAIEEGTKHANGTNAQTADATSAVTVKKKRCLLRKDTPATIDVAGSRRSFLNQMHEDTACVEEVESDEEDQHVNELSEKVRRIPQKKISSCIRRTSERGNIDLDMTLTETLSTYLPKARNSIMEDDIEEEHGLYRKQYPLEHYKLPNERRNEGLIHAETKSGTKVLTRKSTPAKLPSVNRAKVAHNPGGAFEEEFKEEDDEEEEGDGEHGLMLEGAVGGLH
ncbi:uncharacterized protein LOC135499426 [Lineus longissimus]|uniref:uncharacterized protein LOC135499426 n=1 Tax=Lineus longissimus TaxID=88925 RepID=UPI00315D70AF